MNRSVLPRMAAREMREEGRSPALDRDAVQDAAEVAEGCLEM